MKIIAIIIALFFIPVSADAGSFWTKLIYAGHDSKQEREQAQKDKFEATGEDFKIIGNYAFTKIGDDISMVSKQRLLKAYKHGGEDAVVKLIGKDLDIQFDEVAAKAKSELDSIKKHAKDAGATFKKLAEGHYELDFGDDIEAANEHAKKHCSKCKFD